MKKSFGIAAACLALLVAATTGHGYTIDDVIIEYWAGSGDDEAVLVVDFGSSANYAFGYRWNGSAVSWDMLDAIDAAGSLEKTATNYGTVTAPGWLVDTISYDGHTMGVGNYFANFFISDDGENWTVPNYGVSSRSLSDGVFDGFGEAYSEWYGLGHPDNVYEPADPPTTPIPEPAALCLLAVGAPALLRRRRPRA